MLYHLEQQVYTDNKKVLQSGITHHKADKLSSLEIIGEYPKSIRKLNHSPDNMNKDFMHDKVNHSISNLADVTSKDIHPKILDDVLKTTITSDKMTASIQHIASQTLQKDYALVSSYRAMLDKDTAKTISPVIEKEI